MIFKVNTNFCKIQIIILKKMKSKTKQLFYLAKSVDNSLTVEKIVQMLNNQEIIERKVYTKNMVNNMINGKSYDENILNVINGVIKQGKTTLQNA